MEQQPLLEQTETQILQQNLNSLHRQEEALSQSQQRVAAKLGYIAMSDVRKEIVQHDTALVVGERKLTDPNKSDREPAVAPETLSSKATLGWMIGKIAAKNSVYTPEGEARAERVEAAKEKPLQTKREANAEIRLAKRLKKQELRQERTRQSEIIFGGGIGLGKESKVRTLLEKSQQKRELKKEYVEARKNPDLSITPEDYLDELGKIKRSSVVVPTKEVRRNMRRERAGAIMITGRATKPRINPITKLRKNRLNKKQEKLNNRIDNVSSRRAEIEAELSRRAEEE